MKNVRTAAAPMALIVGLAGAGAPAFCQTSAAKAAASTSPEVTPTTPLTDPAQGTTGGPTSQVGDPTIAGDIIVTANKRAENVQRVPLAVSVVAPTQLAIANVRNFSDLGKISPSLVIRPDTTPQSSAVSLRGVGTYAFGIGVESSVAVLVDEVPLAFTARAFTSLPDVERIEILRGPQSTLYGKSASAGLINVITRAPTESLRIQGNAVVTSDRERGVNASVAGPITDTLGYVVSAGYNYFAGNVRNLFLDKRSNGAESINLRGKLRWEPSYRTTITLSANYVDGKSTIGRPFVRLSPTALFMNRPGLSPDIIFPGVTVSEKNQNISNNFESRAKYKGGGGYARAEIGVFDDMNLVAISSYDRFHLDDTLDVDDNSSSGPFGNNIMVGAFNSEQVTEEVRLQSSSAKPFRYTLGAYYAHVDFNRPFMRGPVFTVASWYATSTSRQAAGFAQFDWDILPKLTLTGGGRVQNERVSYTYLERLSNSFYSGSDARTAGTYKASLRYQFTPDISAFATRATGYKGQTYDLTSGFNQNRALAGAIRPERSSDWEAGLRTQFFERRLTFNVTVFDTKYRNLQAQTIENLPDGSTNFRLTNVGGLHTRGIEVETSARLTSDLNLGGSVTYLDANFTDFPAAQCYPGQTAAQGSTLR